MEGGGGRRGGRKNRKDKRDIVVDPGSGWKRVGEEEESEKEGRRAADRTIQSSQEATKGQQRADQIIQFIWIGERASE